MIEMQDRFVHIDEAVFFPVGNEFLLRDISRNSYFKVTQFGKSLWELFDGSNTVEQVIQKALDEHPTAEKDSVTKQTLEFIENLLNLKLLYPRQSP